MLGSSLRGNIKFEFDVATNVWPIEVDISELELAMVNVAVNARDAMPDGGTFILSARNSVLQSHSNSARLAGEYVTISLSDTGTGIPKDVLAKIFEPFFTTKTVGKGTGLGLSQVYGFATQSGGAVTALSDVGKGTTITLYLPRSHRAPQPSVETVGVSVGKSGAGTVLVVEDNADVAEVTGSLVEQLGYHVLHAASASEALDRLKSNGKVRLVLSDIVMPGGMNGIELAAEIRRHYPDISILLTSGYSEAAYGAKLDHEILRKPFELAALEKAINGVLIQ